MKRTCLIFFILLIPALTLAACGVPSTPVRPAPLPEPTITLETKPEPAVMGDLELILTVKDASGSPITDALVMVTADHTDMTGMSMTGPATGQGSGRYSIRANFSMTGNWKLFVEVKKGDQSFTKDIPVIIN